MAHSFQIVIVLHNSAEWIKPCMTAIERLNHDGYETCVVDNASSDGGADLIENDYPDVRLVRSQFNRGFAGGNNLGADQSSKSDFILLLNPDTEIHSDCLGHLEKAFAEHARLGVAGCKIYGPDGKTIQHVGGGLRANALSYHVGEGEREEGQYTGLRRCTYVQGAAMAVRRCVWEALGGFDEGFYPAYYEETDFCRRAWDSGWKVGVVCEATVIHHQQSAQQVQSTSFLEPFFRGRARYLVKHYRAWDWIARFVPSELYWLLSRRSKSLRRLAVRTLWEAWTQSPSRGERP